MFRTAIRHGAVLAGLAFLAILSPSEGQTISGRPEREARPVEFQVLLPADAQLEIEGIHTTTPGVVRNFRSPPVPVGSRYAYSLVATWRGQILRREVTLVHDQQNVIDWRGDFQAPAGQPQAAAPAAERPLSFKVVLPEDAELTIDDFKTHSTGELRSFESPAVTVEKTYRYELTAQWRGQTLKRDVQITHDGSNVFDWRTDLQALAAARSPATPKNPEPSPRVEPTPPAVAQQPPKTQPPVTPPPAAPSQPVVTQPPTPPAPPAKAIVEIVTTEPEVQVLIRQSGKAVAMLDAKNLKKVELEAGNYDVALGDKFKDFRLSIDSFTVKPGEKQIVMVQRSPRPPAAPRALVEIVTAEPDVQLIVQQNGKPVAVLDTKKQKKVEVPPGKYELKLGEGYKDLVLSAETFALRANEKQIVLVQRTAKQPEPMPPGKALVEIITAEPDAQVIVQQDGKPVSILDARRQQKVEVPPGSYGLKLADGFKELRLSTESFTLKPGEKEIVLVHRPPQPAAPPAPMAPAKGIVEVLTAEPDVQLFLKQDGKKVATLYSREFPKTELPPGKYDVEPGEKSKDLRLSAERFTLQAGDKQIILAQRQMKAPEPPPAPTKATVEIIPADPTVQVIVEQNGKAVAILGGKQLHKAELPAGEYDLKLGGSSKDFKIATNRIALKGGERLIVSVDRMAKPEPKRSTFAVETPPALVLKAGETKRIGVNVKRDNFAEPIHLSFARVPKGVTFKEGTIPGNADSVQIEVIADKTVANAATEVQIVAAGGDKTLVAGLPLQLRKAPGALKLLLPPEGVTVTAGEKAAFDVKVERTDVDGPLSVRFDNLPAQVAVPPQIIDTGKNAATVRVTAEAEAEAGDKPVMVRVAHGFGPDAVVAEGRLMVHVKPMKIPTLHVNVTPSVVKVEAGSPKATSLRVKVLRDGFTGPVTIRFVDLPDGVTIREVTIPADKDEADTTVGVRAEVAAVADKPIKVIGASDAAKAETKLAMTVAKNTPPPPAGTIKLTAIPEVVTLKAGEKKDITVKLEVGDGAGKPRFQLEGLPDKTYWFLLSTPPKVVDHVCTQVIRVGAYDDAAATEARVKLKASVNGGAVKEEKSFRVEVIRD